ncbi:MAG: hypothetical protein ABJH96_05375, partial [Algoriphagus sp.]|uniref:hypothetical protein n=1 Tax=Algoriphagus sp. TaxID=1872435 RepID=UPI003298308C
RNTYYHGFKIWILVNSGANIIRAELSICTSKNSIWYALENKENSKLCIGYEIKHGDYFKNYF